MILKLTKGINKKKKNKGKISDVCTKDKVQ